MPLAVVREIDRTIPDRILVAQLKRDLLKDFIHLGRGVRKESLAAGNGRKLVQNGLAFDAERAAGVASAQDAYRIKHHVGFLKQAAHLAESVARIVVLPVADQKQRPLRVRPARDLFHAQITGVVERRVGFRVDEGELVEHGVAVARAIQEKLGARVKADQEILVPLVAPLDKGAPGLARLPDLVAAHRARHVKDDADGDGRIVVAEEGYLLLHLVVEAREMLLLKPRSEAD